MKNLWSQNSLRPLLLGHLGTGILNFFLSSPGEITSEQMLKILETIISIRKKLEREGGNLIITACPPQIKKEISVWGDPGSSFPYMQSIKDALDPGRILNPGRFAGGL